jgi:hypothetical protein
LTTAVAVVTLPVVETNPILVEEKMKFRWVLPFLLVMVATFALAIPATYQLPTPGVV